MRCVCVCVCVWGGGGGGGGEGGMNRMFITGSGMLCVYIYLAVVYCTLLKVHAFTENTY